MPRIPAPMALANLRWVSRYRHPRFGDRDVEQALKAAFRTPRALEEGVRATGLPRLSTLPRLYHLLAGGGAGHGVGPGHGAGQREEFSVSGRLPSAMHRPVQRDAA